MKTGIEIIADERRRQIEKEGFDTEHDAHHSENELPRAALCYLQHVIARGWLLEYGKELEYQSEELDWDNWPENWDESWWKPKSKLRDLVRAGALIAAEIDRLQAAEAAP